MTRAAKTFAPMILLLAAIGCQGKPPAPAGGYMTRAEDPRRDTRTARKHNAKALELIAKSDLAAAEVELKAALGADLFFGPAHNNLGTVYYRQKLYYKAAWEFQYAAKLMTTQAEPRNNLGLVYEAVGKLEDAASSYAAALQLEPESVEVTANLARVRVRNNLLDDRTCELLEAVVLKDTRPEWVEWARERLAMMGDTPPATDSTIHTR